MIHGYTFLVLLHLSSNIKITMYFNYEPRFNGVFSRNSLPRIKDEAYVINLNDTESKGTQVPLFIDRNTAVYFDSFEIVYIPQEVLSKIKDKWITHEVQDNKCTMCGFYCMAFIECMLAEKIWWYYATLFSLNDYKKNETILYKYFKDEHVKSWWKSCQVFRKIDEINYLLEEIKEWSNEWKI